jgi:glycosyltransferase involved in cell wall biosynthesis
MKILLVSTNQFGYLIDYHRYYVYLKNKGYTVKYITWDYGREKIEKGNPDIIYVPRTGPRPSRLLRFIQTVISYEKKNNFDRIFIHCFPLVSSLLPFIQNDKMRLDIRQVSIHNKKFKRVFFDGLMRFAAKRYKHASIITDLAAEHIGINRYKLLPLGGAHFPKVNSANDSVQQYGHLFDKGNFIFLYVGTLHKRRMIDCVKGFHAYLTKNPGAKASFIIIGSANGGNEYNEIVEYIATYQLENSIHTLGYIPQHKLAIFFQHADCGVTFFPLTPFNDVQPNTKTYEYLINGVPVIATSTKDNVKLLTQTDVPCGIVIGDNADEFERAVAQMINSKDIYNKQAIAEKFSEFEWDNLFRQYLDPVLGLPKQKPEPAL